MEVKCPDCDEVAHFDRGESMVRCKSCGLDVSYKEYLQRYAKRMVQKGIIVSEEDWQPDED